LSIHDLRYLDIFMYHWLLSELFYSPKIKDWGAYCFFSCLSFCHLPKTLTFWMISTKACQLWYLTWVISLLQVTLPFCNVNNVLMKQFSGLSIIYLLFKSLALTKAWLSVELVTLYLYMWLFDLVNSKSLQNWL
jgi:hypothetical protein